MKGDLVPGVSTQVPSASVDDCDADDIPNNYVSEEGNNY